MKQFNRDLYKTILIIDVHLNVPGRISKSRLEYKKKKIKGIIKEGKLNKIDETTKSN